MTFYLLTAICEMRRVWCKGLYIMEKIRDNPTTKTIWMAIIGSSVFKTLSVFQNWLELTIDTL